MYRIARSVCRDLNRALHSRHASEHPYFNFKATVCVADGAVLVSTNVARDDLRGRMPDKNAHLRIMMRSPKQALVDANFEPSDYASARRLRLKGFRKIHNGVRDPVRRKDLVATVALLVSRRGLANSNG
jgi:hypothetical protein